MTSLTLAHAKGTARRFAEDDFLLPLSPEAARAVERARPRSLEELSLAALSRCLWDSVWDLDGYRDLSPRLLYRFYLDPRRPLVASHLLARQLGRKVKRAVMAGAEQTRLPATPLRLPRSAEVRWDLSYRYLHLRAASEMRICDRLWGEVVLDGSYSYFLAGLQYEIECLSGVLDRRRRACTCTQCRKNRRYRPRGEHPYHESATGKAVNLIYLPGLSVPAGSLGPCVEETLARERSRRRAEAMRGPLREWVELSERTKPLLDKAGLLYYEGDFRLWREADRELAAPVARMAELSRMVCEIQGGGDEFLLRDRLWDGLLKRAGVELYPGAAAFTALYY
jgi:hypothetical protein